MAGNIETHVVVTWQEINAHCQSSLSKSHFLWCSFWSQVCYFPWKI